MLKLQGRAGDTGEYISALKFISILTMTCGQTRGCILYKIYEWNERRERGGGQDSMDERDCIGRVINVNHESQRLVRALEIPNFSAKHAVCLQVVSHTYKMF